MLLPCRLWPHQSITRCTHFRTRTNKGSVVRKTHAHCTCSWHALAAVPYTVHPIRHTQVCTRAIHSTSPGSQAYWSLFHLVRMQCTSGCQTREMMVSAHSNRGLCQVNVHRHRHCALVKWSHPVRLSQTCDARVSMRISGQTRPCDERDGCKWDVPRLLRDRVRE